MRSVSAAVRNGRRNRADWLALKIEQLDAVGTNYLGLSELTHNSHKDIELQRCTPKATSCTDVRSFLRLLTTPKYQASFASHRSVTFSHL